MKTSALLVWNDWHVGCQIDTKMSAWTFNMIVVAISGRTMHKDKNVELVEVLALSQENTPATLGPPGWKREFEHLIYTLKE